MKILKIYFILVFMMFFWNSLSIISYGYEINDDMTNSNEFSKYEVVESENDFMLDENVSLDENIIYCYSKETNETTIVDLNDIDIPNLENTDYVHNNIFISELQSINTAYSFYMADPFTYPYKYVCKIISGDGYATGVLVGPNLLLTAAHAVFLNYDPDLLCSSWTCFPKYDNQMYNNLQSGWSTIYYPSGYVNSFLPAIKDKYDWCLCVLENPLGDSVGGYLDCNVYAGNSLLNNMAVKAVGYPRVYDEETNSYRYSGGRMYYSTGYLSNISSLYFDTNAKTYKGMSGGPILNSTNQVVGIIKGHYTADVDTTFGIRITNDINNLIRSLIE